MVWRKIEYVMAKNNGASFEQPTREIVHEIINQDVVKNIAVKRNVQRKGKSTTHQIDVYWSFELASLHYETIVEVKDWKSPVSQGEVMKYKAVLDDLPNQPRGVMVSRAGFQSGAHQFATSNGIVLYELRAPNADDLKGRVNSLELTLTTFNTRATGIRLLHDEEWRISEAVGLDFLRCRD